MTYSVGNLILASDYNTFRSDINSIWANGIGDSGYGESSISSVSAGNIVTSAQWLSIQNALADMSNHQSGSVDGDIPASGMFDVSDVIYAHDNRAGAPISGTDIATAITTLTTNRFNNLGSTFTVENTLGTSSNTRATSWSSTIDCIFELDWSTANNAGHFFNTGGNIQITLTHSNTTGSQNTSWNSTLSGIGTVTMDYTNTTRSGALGTANSVGYYDLIAAGSGVWVNIFTGDNIGQGLSAYAVNDVIIDARVTGTISNGRAQTIEFRVTLEDEHTGPSDTVSSGTEVAWQDRRLTGGGYLSTQTQPTGTVLNSF